MYVTAKDGDSSGEFGCKGLELVNKEESLFLVGSSSVVIVKVIQQINTAVEMVEKSTS